MIQRTSTFNKRQMISPRRDFPHWCLEIQRSVGVALHKEDESIDFLMKQGGSNVVAANDNFGKARFLSKERTFPPYSGRKVKPLSSEEAIELIASQRRQRRHSDSSRDNQRKSLLVQKQRISPEKKKKLSNAHAIRVNAHKPTRHKNETLSPREKVLKTLRLFRLLFKELDREKATAKSRIDYKIRRILKKEGKQVNATKMIGPVPGIEVGDEFQFKSELNLIGLHFYITGGIDYINKGDSKLATSIVASEGEGYNDSFESDVVIYCGQGGNMERSNQKLIEDQKLVTGNLALANSMREKSPVRVIRGIRRLDKRGKLYVYDGLYLVHDYWRERGPRGNVLFKFKLCKVSGQPSINLKGKNVY